MTRAGFPHGNHRPALNRGRERDLGLGRTLTTEIVMLDQGYGYTREYRK